MTIHLTRHSFILYFILWQIVIHLTIQCMADADLFRILLHTLYIYIYIYDYTYSFWYMICFIECHRVIYFLCELLFYLKLPSVLGGVLFFTFSMPDSVFFCTLLNNRESIFLCTFFPEHLIAWDSMIFQPLFHTRRWFVWHFTLLCKAVFLYMSFQVRKYVLHFEQYQKKHSFKLYTITEKSLFYISFHSR